MEDYKIKCPNISESQKIMLGGLEFCVITFKLCEGLEFEKCDQYKEQIFIEDYLTRRG